MNDAALLSFLGSKKNRNVTVTYSPRQLKDAKIVRMAIEDALYTADREIKFERFRDLPPELRDNIYELAMVHFPEQLTTPSSCH